ncbi:hypothetical protein [Shinella sp.]|nr:hypothetical protein [Shinella sp.]
MKSRFLLPGALFITTLVVLVLVIPLAQGPSLRSHDEALRQAFGTGTD